MADKDDPKNGTETESEEPEGNEDEDPSGDDLEKLKAERDKWKAQARKHESRAKSNFEAAKKLEEIENASKTEAERNAEKLSAAEKRAAEAERQLIRLEVAAAKGLTPAQAKRLVGDTKEELEADADELLSTFSPADKDGASGTEGSGKPKERLRPGAAPDVEPEDNDPAKLAAKIPRDRF